MSGSRIEALLASFPKLIHSGSQHTFVETDSVRFVYQPLEDLYMILITTKNSNILQDIDTLHLLARAVSDQCHSLEEHDILMSCFEILEAFDEIVSMGYRENVSLSQVRTMLEMDSHEERIHEIIERNKELEAKEELKRRARQLEMQRRDAARRQQGGFGGDGYQGVSKTYDTPAAAPVHSMPESQPAAPAAPFKGKGMQLGKKPKGAALMGSLQKTDRRIPSESQPVTPAQAPAPAPVAAPVAAPAPAPAPAPAVAPAPAPRAAPAAPAKGMSLGSAPLRKKEPVVPQPSLLEQDTPDVAPPPVEKSPQVAQPSAFAQQDVQQQLAGLNVADDGAWGAYGADAQPQAQADSYGELEGQADPYGELEGQADPYGELEGQADPYGEPEALDAFAPKDEGAAFDAFAPKDEGAAFDAYAPKDEGAAFDAYAPKDEGAAFDAYAPKDESAAFDAYAPKDEGAAFDAFAPKDEGAAFDAYAPKDEGAAFDAYAPKDEGAAFDAYAPKDDAALDAFAQPAGVQDQYDPEVGEPEDAWGAHTAPAPTSDSLFEPADAYASKEPAFEPTAEDPYFSAGAPAQSSLLDTDDVYEPQQAEAALQPEPEAPVPAAAEVPAPKSLGVPEPEPEAPPTPAKTSATLPASMAAPAPAAAPAVAPAAPAPTAAPAAPAPAAAAAPASVELLAKERVTFAGNRDGGLDSLEIKGDLHLKITDAALARLSLGVTAGAQFGGKEVTYRTHPHVDKNVWESRRIALRDPKRPFPLNQQVGVLRWRSVTKDESQKPLGVMVWLSPTGDGGCEVNVEYELENSELALSDVSIVIPVPAGAEPAVIDPEDGAYEFDAQNARVIWRLDSISAQNPAANLEFTVPSGGDDVDVFFPVSVEFTSSRTLLDLQVNDVTSQESGAPIPFAFHAQLNTDHYLVH